MAFVPQTSILRSGGGGSHRLLPSSTFVPSPGLRWAVLKRNARSRQLHFTLAPIPKTTSMSIVDVKKHEVFMPALSSTMTEGRIVQWLKQPGDAITAGEPIMVVESDKADMDVESFESGYLAAIYVEEGESCDVGITVGIIVENLDDIDKVESAAPASSPASAASPAEAPVAVPAPPTPSAAPAPSLDKPPLYEVFMPALSSTMTEGKIVEWLKSEGDHIESGEYVMIVESDKADMDVESFDTGFLAHIAVQTGESSAVGEPVGYIAKSEAEIPVVKAWANSQSSKSSSSTDSDVVDTAPAPAAISTPASAPAVAPSVAKVINEGRIIASPLAKAVAKKAGVDLRFVVGTGPDGRIIEADVIKAQESGLTEASPASSGPLVPSGKVIATPEAKKVAKKEKIDLNAVTGTGNFGRITAEDVLRAAGKTPAPKPTKTTKETVPAVSVTKNESAEKAPVPAGAVVMNAMQKAVVQNMNASLTVPVFRLTYSIKTTALDELYAKVKPKGVTISALLAKAAAITLEKHPIMNAQYTENSILYRSDINVAMAVALKDGGLITPTLKNVDQTDLYSLSRSWKDLVKRSAEKKLSPDEYNSGTFFISNLGMFGVDQFDAILPPGAPAILAIGASKPVVGLQSNGLVGVEKQMNVTLTADHRHIYGADAAKFLKDLTELIEGDIMQLLM